MSQPPHLPTVQRQAQALAESGDRPAAIRLLSQAVEAARPAYGEDHQDVLGSAYLLARFHQESDDPAGARRVLEEALAAGQRRWGDADPLMLAISFDLGTVAEELGNRHEARRNFTRVANAGPAVLGADHWTVCAAREYLGEPQPAHDATVVMKAVPAQTEAVEDQPRPSSAAPASGASGPVSSLSSPPAEQPWGPRPVSAPPPVPDRAAPASGVPFTPPQPSAAPASASPYPAEQPRPYSAAPASASPYREQQPGPFSAVPASAYPGQVGPGGRQARRRWGRYRLAVAVTSVAAVAAVVGAVFVVQAVRSPDGPGGGTVGTPPGEVSIRDEQASVTVSWTDPSGGKVPFIVTGGQAGQKLNALATVDAGKTSYTATGLNPRSNYCFTVLAVYGTDSYATSGQVCTTRATSSPG